ALVLVKRVDVVDPAPAVRVVQPVRGLDLPDPGAALAGPGRYGHEHLVRQRDHVALRDVAGAPLGDGKRRRARYRRHAKDRGDGCGRSWVATRSRRPLDEARLTCTRWSSPASLPG